MPKWIFQKTQNRSTGGHTVLAKSSSKLASVSFDQGFQIWVGWNWSEHHLSVFCIDPIVPGFVVYYVNCDLRHWPRCALLSWPMLTTLHCTLNDCYVNLDLFVCKKNRNGFPNSSIDLISSPVRALGCTSSICNFMYNLFKSFLKEHSSFHEPAFLQNIHNIAWKLRKYHVYEK